MNQRFNEASMNNKDNILGTSNSISLSKNEKTISNQYLSSIEISCVDDIEISVEILLLKPKDLHAKKHLYIVLTNGKSYVTYDKILNNELVIKVTPYKNTILEMLSLIEPTLSTKQFTNRTKVFIIYNYDAYNNINIQKKNENMIEVITNVRTKNFLGKLDSILQDSELVFKIIDFSHSRIIVSSQDGNKTNKRYGSNPYIPPEIFNYGICSKKSDLWSLGVMLLLFTREINMQYALEQYNYLNLYIHIATLQTNNFKDFDNYPFITKILKLCLIENVENRCDIQKLLELLD